jgi:uncharacterized protein (DUF302 family)
MASPSASPGGKGIVDVPSNHSVDETVEKLKGILEAKGVTLFALVDHSGEAEKVGMKMPPTKLLIFGNPKAGTPLMLATPSIAITESNPRQRRPPRGTQASLMYRKCLY